jgi:uncharacterized protein (TIGR04255 family)
MQSMDNANPTQPELQDAPLRVVLCQLRFPPLFRFEEANTRSFAAALGEEYPLVSEDQLQVMELNVSPQGAVRSQGSPTHAVFRLESEQRDRAITLGHEWLSLETTEYAGFDEFSEQWRLALGAALDAFDFAHELRLGLRYVNELEVGPSASPERLRDILTDNVLGALNLDASAERLVRSWQEVRFRHDHGGYTMQHGYVENADQAWVYILDYDGYREGKRAIEVDEQVEALKTMNHHIFRLFRKSVTESTFARFRPRERQ